MNSLKVFVLVFLVMLAPLANSKEAKSMAADPEMEKNRQ